MVDVFRFLEQNGQTRGCVATHGVPAYQQSSLFLRTSHIWSLNFRGYLADRNSLAQGARVFTMKDASYAELAEYNRSIRGTLVDQKKASVL